MSKLKIGIVGAGTIVSAHLPRLSERDDVELTAIADINQSAAQTLAEKWGIARVATDYREWLREVDAILVCIPTWLHANVAIEALRAGKATFCEKPMARSLAEAEAMLMASRETGAPLQIGFVRRFDDEWLAWRKAVLDERIGRPVVWRDVAAGAGPYFAPWFTQDEKGGGPFLDGCVHNYDFALFTFGAVEWVFAHGRTLRESNTAIDTGSATIRFQSGDELLLAWSWGLPKGCGGTRVFEFLGPNGTLSFPGGADENGNRHFVLTHGQPVLADGSTGEEIPSEKVSFPANALTQGFARQMDEFIAVARREKTPSADGCAGREALRVALAVLESARTGEVVRL